MPPRGASNPNGPATIAKPYEIAQTENSATWHMELGDPLYRVITTG